MEDDKSEKISISMPKVVLVAMEKYLEDVPQASRSSWLTGLAMRELEKEGMLPGNERAEINAVIDEIGEESALSILRKAARAQKRQTAAA